MWPAVLVTLGLLFLVANTSNYPFERTWPILLIVIGAIKVVQYVIPDDGHIPPGQYPPPPYQADAYGTAGQSAASPVSGPVVTPPPAPVVGLLDDGKEGNGEVRHG
jgi:hypothetical protein